MNLDKRAMLLNPTIRLPLLGERKDKQATATVESHHGVTHKSAKASKYLIDKNAKSVKGVIAAAQNLRAVVYENSFPWMDSKLRLSTSKAYPYLRQSWDDGVIRLNNCVANYLIDYPALCSKAEFELGSLYDESQYPKRQDLESLYKVELELWPLPQSGHFVADIADAAAEEARVMMEDKLKQVVTASVSDMVGRAEKVVAHFVEKLETYGETPDGKTIGIFRDTLVSNIQTQADIIRRLNMTDDSSIESLAIQLDRLSRVTGEALRTDPQLRESKVTEAKALLAKLDGYRGVDSQVADIIGSVADYY